MSGSSAQKDSFGTDGTERVHPLRRAWDVLPSFLRRAIMWTMRSERVRLKLLSSLGLRDESAFYPLSVGGLQAIDAALEYVTAAGVPGDYFEFGVYRGYSFWYAEQSSRVFADSRMRFFGFDSFEGLPVVSGEDRKAGIFVSGDYRCTLEDVQGNLTEHGIDWERSHLIKGFFDQSLTPETRAEHSMSSAAVVMIDCDLYQSTVPVLEFIAGMIQDNTVFLFDDWRCFPREDQGEPRAFREFLASHSHWRAEPFMEFGTYGQAFIMHSSA